jgi:hypothetical protein
MAATE